GLCRQQFTPPSRQASALRHHQVDRLGAFALLVRFDLECNALSFGQIFQSGPLDGGDVNEHIAAAVIGLDEAVPAFSIKELDCPSHGHRENSSPVLLRRYAHVAYRPTGHSLPEAWPPEPTGLRPRSAWIFVRALSLRRNHSRK